VRHGRRFTGVSLLPIGIGLVLVSAVGAVTILVNTNADRPTVGTDTPAAIGTDGATGGPTLGPTLKPSTSASPSKAPIKKDQGGCPVTGGGAFCPSAPPFAAASGKRWKLAFSEEFTGTDYDHSKLTPCFDWNYGDCTATFNNGREYYQPSQVKVSGGTAKLIAAPTAAHSAKACQNGTCTYKAGLLSTARPRADNGSDYLFKFTYGYVESRFKFPATQGFFTAFWMLPTDPDYNYRSEIDILELLGDDPTTMFMTYHHDNREQSFAVNNGKFNNGACPVKNYSKEFVRMGLDWEPNRIAWYIDGVKCAEFTDASEIENGPMQLILHMMVDNDWQRRWDVGLEDPTLTRQLEVDYIRVYQQRSK
jgi:beta-glucanase (GH16 family)